MSELRGPSWLPPVPAAPPSQPRTLEEAAEAVFRTQDLLVRAGEEAEGQRQRARGERLAGLRDEAESLAFMGRPALSALEYYVLVSDEQDRVEEQERKRGQAKRIEAQQQRIAELEAQAASASTRADRAARDLSRANQGWGAERRRSEGASFRGDSYRVR